MKEVSQQLLHQRLRNRAIELFEMHSSLENIANLGAFEMINMVDDWLPLNYGTAPNVFSKSEKEVIAEFLWRCNSAADATAEDTWDVQWLRSSEEWVRLSEFAKQALETFMNRGRLSEDYEEDWTS